MSVIEEFVARYSREYDFFEQAARLVSQTLEARLRAEGVRAMVTYRAKSVSRLEAKLRTRSSRKHYTNTDDVYADIVDLAGVRVALYFPGQREQVGKLIGEIFSIHETREFPGPDKPKYAKRFSGYAATHYRVRLRDASLSDSQRRFTEAAVEIQVASVLMHAWSEVEHDLVYKPLQGDLSEDEYAILDELNGLVLAGEVALERLERAGVRRIESNDRRFGNHFDLAAFLLSSLQGLTAEDGLHKGLGRVDVLFALLRKLELAHPAALRPLLKQLHGDLEQRPISEQIVDQLLTADDSRYAIYDAVKRQLEGGESSAPTDPVSTQSAESVGRFLQSWIALEKEIGSRFDGPKGEAPPPPSARVLGERDLAPDDAWLEEFERLRRTRNRVVHGLDLPDADQLSESARSAASLLVRLAAKEPPPRRRKVSR